MRRARRPRRQDGGSDLEPPAVTEARPIEARAGRKAALRPKKALLPVTGLTLDLGLSEGRASVRLRKGCGTSLAGTDLGASALPLVAF